MRIRLRSSDVEYNNLLIYGSIKKTVLGHICALLLAVAPIFQHYRGLYKNMGFTILLVCFPILFTQFLRNCMNKSYSLKCIVAMVPMLIFQLYTAMIHFSSIMRLFYIMFIICLFIFIASGCVNGRLFFKYASYVITIATILIVIQYISYYIFHYKIDLRPLQLLVEEDTIWMRSYINEQKYGVTFYRPSAFFLEPSHLFLYSFPILAVYLLSQNMSQWRFKKAITVSLALLLSTSGFGVVAVVGIWCLYLLFYKDNGTNYKKVLSRILSPKVLLIFTAFIFVLIIAYFTIPIFQQAIMRIFINEDGSTAIEGRIRLASMYAQRIEGSDILFGNLDATSNIEFNLSGFFSTYFKWGIVGIILSYWFYLRGLFCLKKSYFWINAIIIVISYFTAHTHGTFYMLYFFIYLMDGYYRTDKHLSIQ